MSRVVLFLTLLLVSLNLSHGQRNNNVAPGRNRIIATQLNSIFQRPPSPWLPMPTFPGTPGFDPDRPMPNFTIPIMPAPCSAMPQPQLPILPPKQQPNCISSREATYYSSEIDAFVTSIHNETRKLGVSFMDPFASELQTEFRDIPSKISEKILELTSHKFSSANSEWSSSDESEDNSRSFDNYEGQSPPQEEEDDENESCKLITISNMLRAHPGMNYKFWLKGFYYIVLTRPELTNSLDSDKLNTLSGFFVTPRTWAQMPPPQQCPPPPPLQPGFEFPRMTCTGQQGYTTSKEENNLWYFREDLGLNLYHAAWHVVHPHTKECSGGGTSCHSDRRGELFYNFHRNLLARYDTERMTHGLPPVTPLRLGNGAVINPGYSPNYDSFMDRMSGSVLPNALSPSQKRTFSPFLSQIQMVARTVESYDTARTRSGRNSVDELGNLIESSSLSPSQATFGDIHNRGHVVLGSIGLTTSSLQTVIAQPETAMRDPIFYQWHRYVDFLFQKHKSKLAPYQLNGGDFPLAWNLVSVDTLSVTTPTISGTPIPVNTLNTFWKERTYQASFNNPYPQCRKHLDHDDFTFNLKLTNNYGSGITSTVRIFIAPRTDHNGNTLSLEKQRDFVFILEIFNQYLRPGENVISRKSTWLSTAGPRWDDKDLRRNRGSDSEFFCGCGHPHNLLLPKGKDCNGGEEFDLIVLVTDSGKYPFNHVEQDDAQCIKPPVICGIDGTAENKYPDLVLPMGYPFDRNISNEYQNQHVSFLAGKISNMMVTKIKILHHDVTVPDGKSWRDIGHNHEGVSTNPKCRKPGPSSSTESPSTTTPSGTDCWYSYAGIQYCYAIPPGYGCEYFYGLKYCKPSTTPTTTPRPPYECFIDQNMIRHCHPPPEGYTCVQYGTEKYCRPISITTTTTTPSPAECFYDHQNMRHCHDPPRDYTCRNYYGVKYCYPPTTTTTPRSTTSGCTYDYYGGVNCGGYGYQTGNGYSQYNYGTGYGQGTGGGHVHGYGSRGHNHG